MDIYGSFQYRSEALIVGWEIWVFLRYQPSKVKPATMVLLPSPCDQNWSNSV